MLRKDRILVSVLVFYMFYSICYAYDLDGGFYFNDGELLGGPQVTVFPYPSPSPTPQFQSYTWVKPYGARFVYVWCVGGGGAGGAGAKGTTSIVLGGGGGGAGGVSESWFFANELPPTVNVSVGRGGRPTTARATTNGSVPANTGSLASNSSFFGSTAGSDSLESTTPVIYVRAPSGSAGGAGNLSGSANGGAAQNARPWGGIGGGTGNASQNTQTCTSQYSYSPGSGGGGGGAAFGSITATGANGRDGCFNPSSGGSGGTRTTGQRNGSNGTSSTGGKKVGGGGGGGAVGSDTVVGDNAGDGGEGGSPGGGGGGGGAGINSYSDGGLGGRGGNGQCVVITF